MTPPYDDLLNLAHAMGEDHGRSAASWYFDGNTPDEAYRRVLAGIEDGDPEILDTFPNAPLSGEWADDPTPDSVLVDLIGRTDWDSLVTDLLSAYEDGFSTAVHDSISETAYEMAQPFTITAYERTITFADDESEDYDDETDSGEPEPATIAEALDLMRQGGWDNVDVRDDSIILYPADSHQDIHTGAWESTSYAIAGDSYWIAYLTARYEN